MLTKTNAILLNGLPLGMAFELFIVIALIVLFIVSLCSLMQKIRRSYDRDGEDRRRITVSEIYIQDTPPNYVEVQGEISQGVYPAGIAPPPYTEYFVDPPPKYDDVMNRNQPVQPATHQPTQNQNAHPQTTLAQNSDSTQNGGVQSHPEVPTSR